MPGTNWDQGRYVCVCLRLNILSTLRATERNKQVPRDSGTSDAVSKQRLSSAGSIILLLKTQSMDTPADIYSFMMWEIDLR